MATTKPCRRRKSEQFNIRATPLDAALIRAAFQHRNLNKVAVELLVAEARAWLANQGELIDAGDVPAGRRTKAA